MSSLWESWPHSSQLLAQISAKQLRYDFASQPPTPRPRANLSMSNELTIPSTIYDLNWYPDSGATHHMTLDPHNLMEKTDYGGSERVIIGNGSGLQINHVGNSFLNLI